MKQGKTDLHWNKQNRGNRNFDTVSLGFRRTGRGLRTVRRTVANVLLIPVNNTFSETGLVIQSTIAHKRIQMNKLAL